MYNLVSGCVFVTLVSFLQKGLCGKVLPIFCGAFPVEGICQIKHPCVHPFMIVMKFVIIMVIKSENELSKHISFVSGFFFWHFSLSYILSHTMQNIMSEALLIIQVQFSLAF